MKKRMVVLLSTYVEVYSDVENGMLTWDVPIYDSS